MDKNEDSMISDTELDSLWRDFDPYSDHDIGNNLCMECLYPTRTCHKCGNLLHNEEYETTTDDGEPIIMVWHLCEECGYQHTEESNKKVRR